jgi:predicted ATPase
MTAGAAAAAAMIAQAIKASGTIVSVEPIDFLTVLERQSEPMVVKSTGGFFGTWHRYLTSYKGLAFYVQSRMPIDLPVHCELIEAKKIWIPG